MLCHFDYNPATETRTADQKFLGEIVWPLIKDSCLIHDSVYRLFGAKDFPTCGALPPGRHLGDIDAVFDDARSAASAREDTGETP